MTDEVSNRSINSFADEIIVRTFQSKIDGTFYASLDAGFGHYGNHAIFEWSGKTREEAIKGCANWVRRDANGEQRHPPHDIVCGSSLLKLKQYWSGKERLAAAGIDLQEFDNAIRNGKDKFNWGLVSYDKINGDFYREMEGERLEAWLQMIFFDLKDAFNSGADVNEIDEQAVYSRASLEGLRQTYRFTCEFTEETYDIVDERINSFKRALTAAAPAI